VVNSSGEQPWIRRLNRVGLENGPLSKFHDFKNLGQEPVIFSKVFLFPDRSRVLAAFLIERLAY
jgi:hypothetical protein